METVPGDDVEGGGRREVEQGRREVEQGRGEEEGKGKGGKKKMNKRRYCSVLHNISSLYRRLLRRIYS